MCIKQINVLMTLILLHVSSVCFAQAAKNVNIVVNAHHGVAVAITEWQPTIDFLQQTLPQYAFNLIPIPPNQLLRLKSLIEQDEVDFIITQPAIYVDLELNYGISRILTMVKKGGFAEFGSAIIVRADSDISSIDDLKNKTVAGVAMMGFGGWLIGYKEMLDHGFDPYRNAKRVEFLGTQDKEVKAVLDGAVDAAVIRTGVLEHLSEQGEVNIDDFRILSAKKYPDFSLKISTSLYPEWAFAKTRKVSNVLSKAVGTAMLSLKKGSEPANMARFQEWTFPYDYQPVHQLLKTLHVGPYDKVDEIRFMDFVEQHKTEFYVILVLALLILILLVALARTNFHISKARKKISESEVRYRQIFSNNQAVTFLIDPVDGQIRDCNKAAIDFYGYDEKTLRSMKISDIDIMPITELKTLIQNIKHKKINFMQAKHRLASGEIRHVEVYPTAIESGDEILNYAIVFDVTEKMDTEKALRRSQKMDAVGQLTGGIAHDFNNILGIILGNIELLAEQSMSENQSKKIAAIKKAAMRAADLTSKLLNFTRTKPVETVTVNINLLIVEMESLIARAITPEVSVELKFSSELAQTNINIGDFEDTLLNLVLNARDSMAGMGVLTIETNNKVLDASYCKLNPTVKSGEYIELIISDSGVGMSSRQIEHIFEPFYTTKGQGKGTGLGLSMVYGFVNRSGGHVKVYSEINIGTSFRLYFPRVVAGVQENAASYQFAAPLAQGSETLLVVDDEDDLLALAQDALQAQGYTVIVANNGKQALEQLQNHPDIALIFSDVVMPAGMNGYELAEQAVAKYPKLKVLLTSGFSQKAIAKNGQAQFDAHLLTKPYSLHDMVKTIQDMLNAKSEG